jgi:hypothetical protein
MHICQCLIKAERRALQSGDMAFSRRSAFKVEVASPFKCRIVDTVFYRLIFTAFIIGLMSCPRHVPGVWLAWAASCLLRFALHTDDLIVG